MRHSVVVAAVAVAAAVAAAAAADVAADVVVVDFCPRDAKAPVYWYW